MEPIQIPNLDNQNNNQQEPELSDFAKGVLNDIPEEDRSTVAKYLNTWDGNVTKKFQEYSDKLKPYEELGVGYEDLQSSLFYTNLLQSDPMEFIRTVQQAMKESGMSLDDFMEDDDDVEPQGGYEIPPHVQQRMDQLETMIGTMYEQFTGYTNNQNEQQQIAAFDNYLQDMHSRHGDFDDEWVTLQFEKGLSEDEVMKKWNSDFLDKFGSQRRPAPNLLPSNGAVRNDQVDPSKMSPAERKNWMVQALEAGRG